MATLDSVMTEVKDAATLIGRRPDGKMSSAVIKSICAKIACLPTFSTGDASKLLACIDEVPLSTSLKELLTDAGDSRLAVHISNEAVPRGPCSGAPPRDQTVRYLNNYPTCGMSLTTLGPCHYNVMLHWQVY